LPKYECIAHFVGTTINAVRLETINVPPAVLSASSRYQSVLNTNNLPFQLDTLQLPDETTKKYLQRRVVEIIKY